VWTNAICLALLAALVSCCTCAVCRVEWFIKTCEAGLVLSVIRILRAALTKFRVNVCVCNYSSQTTKPIKIIPANRASYVDCYRLLKFEIFTPPYITPKKHFWEPRNVKPMGNRGLVRPIQKATGKYSQFMAQITWFIPRMVLFGVRTMSDIIWGKSAPNKQKRAWIGIFKPN